jgi:hypothetical protein
MDSSMEVLQKTKNRTTIQSSNTSPGHIFERNVKLEYNKDTNTPMFNAALFTTAKLWE